MPYPLRGPSESKKKNAFHLNYLKIFPLVRVVCWENGCWHPAPFGGGESLTHPPSDRPAVQPELPPLSLPQTAAQVGVPRNMHASHALPMPMFQMSTKPRRDPAVVRQTSQFASHEELCMTPTPPSLVQDTQCPRNTPVHTALFPDFRVSWTMEGGMCFLYEVFVMLKRHFFTLLNP